MGNTRHQAREWAVQFLFQLDYNEPEDLDEDRELFWQERDAEDRAEVEHFDQARAFGETLIEGVLENLEALDERLGAYADKWAVHRLAGVDRNVLRLALYELFYREDIPPVVAVNEAIELAKELSSDESGRFVNGILDRALKDVQRPHRGGKKDPAHG